MQEKPTAAELLRMHAGWLEDTAENVRALAELLAFSVDPGTREAEKIGAALNYLLSQKAG